MSIETIREDMRHVVAKAGFLSTDEMGRAVFDLIRDEMGSDEMRRTVAVAIDHADDQWQHGIGSGGYDIDGPPLWLADAAIAALVETLGGSRD